jgi:hypothetical protein
VDPLERGLGTVGAAQHRLQRKQTVLLSVAQQSMTKRTDSQPTRSAGGRGRRGPQGALPEPHLYGGVEVHGAHRRFLGQPSNRCASTRTRWQGGRQRQSGHRQCASRRQVNGSSVDAGGEPIGSGRSRPLDTPGLRLAGDSESCRTATKIDQDHEFSHVVTRTVGMPIRSCGRPRGCRERIARHVRITQRSKWSPSGVQVDANVARSGGALGLHRPLEHGWHFGVGSSLCEADSSEFESPAPLCGVDWHHRRRWLSALGFTRG